MLKKKQKNKQALEHKEVEIAENDLPMHKKGDLWDVISPEGIAISDISDDYGIVKQSLGTKTFFRPFYIPREGYPRKMQTNWLYQLTSSGAVDVMIDVEKIGKTNAIKALQQQMTIFQSNLSFQLKRGNQDQVLDLQTKIADTNILMEEIQFSDNDSYNVAITGMLYGDSERELDKYSEYIEDEMSSLFFKLVAAWGRVKKGYRGATILGKNEINNSIRNLDRRALATFAPFISGSGKFNGGIPIGVNMTTGQKEFYNAFGTKAYTPDNYNMAIVGQSGSGKSLALKLLMARETTGMGVYTRLIDVEGEFVDTVKELGGINITLSEESDIRINPMDINVTHIPFDLDDDELEELEQSDEREIVEKNGTKYITFIPIREKLNEMLDFFDIICRGKKQEDDGLNVFERNFLEQALKYLYYDKCKLTTHPSSLYEKVPQEVNGQIIQSHVKKTSPTLSDVYDYLKEHFSEEDNCERLIAAIRPFLKDGSKPIFDGQTYLGRNTESVDINSERIVNFNINKMEEGFLRPIAYHVVLTNMWEYFAKNVELATTPKIILADEFWTMVDNEQTVSFAEKVARRIRKRNGGFRFATQDFYRILESKKARGILQNTHSFLFFKQSNMDMKLLKENFDLSQGEMNILFQNPEKGEGILRVGKSSVYLRTDPSKEELLFVESNKAVLAELKNAALHAGRGSEF